MPLRAGAGGWAEGLESVGEGFKDAGLDGKEVEFSISADVDESAGLQFLDVVRERGGRNRQGFTGGGAGKRTGSARNAFQQVEALRIGERFEKCRALGAGETRDFG